MLHYYLNDEQVDESGSNLVFYLLKNLLLFIGVSLLCSFEFHISLSYLFKILNFHRTSSIN